MPRVMEITTPLGADVLLFHGMHAREELGRIGEFQLDLLSAKSDITVAGLVSGSTQRTVNGTASGTESTVGTNDDGIHFTSTRVAGDTISCVIIPLQNGRPTYPTAGSIVRSMQATVTLSGQTPTSSSRREVITFDGSSTAQITVTQDGVTKTGTLSLVGGGVDCHD